MAPKKRKAASVALPPLQPTNIIGLFVKFIVDSLARARSSADPDGFSPDVGLGACCVFDVEGMGGCALFALLTSLDQRAVPHARPANLESVSLNGFNGNLPVVSAKERHLEMFLRKKVCATSAALARLRSQVLHLLGCDRSAALARGCARTAARLRTLAARARTAALPRGCAHSAALARLRSQVLCSLSCYQLRSHGFTCCARSRLFPSLLFLPYLSLLLSLLPPSLTHLLYFFTVKDN